MAGPQIAVIQQQNRGRRNTRRPQTRFQLENRLYELQPFCMFPTLPNETMTDLMLQYRAFSSPVKSQLLGAHMEHYFYHVTIRQMEAGLAFQEDYYNNSQAIQNPTPRADGRLTNVLTNLFVADLGTDNSLVEFVLNSGGAGADVAIGDIDNRKYHFDATETCDGFFPVPWLQMGMVRIVQEYFRTDGEDALGVGQKGYLDGMFIGSNQFNDFLHSAQLESELPDGQAGIDVDLNADSTITTEEIKTAWQQVTLLQEMGFGAELTYEEFLMSYGIRQQQADLLRPEEIRYKKAWAYPTIHVEPSTGAPSGAFVWNERLRADKHRFFREHGFIIGVCCVRPKVYLGSVQQNAANLLIRTGKDWLPTVLNNDPASSFRRIVDVQRLLTEFPTADNDPTPCADTTPVWVDLKDLYTYGQDFLNFSLSSTANGLVAQPDADLQRRYPTRTDINNLFAGSTDAARLIKQDGVCSVTINGSVIDTSESTAGNIALP